MKLIAIAAFYVTIVNAVSESTTVHIRVHAPSENERAVSRWGQCKFPNEPNQCVRRRHGLPHRQPMVWSVHEEARRRRGAVRREPLDGQVQAQPPLPHGVPAREPLLRQVRQDRAAHRLMRVEDTRLLCFDCNEGAPWLHNLLQTRCSTLTSTSSTMARSDN